MPQIEAESSGKTEKQPMLLTPPDIRHTKIIFSLESQKLHSLIMKMLVYTVDLAARNIKNSQRVRRSYSHSSGQRSSVFPAQAPMGLEHLHFGQHLKGMSFLFVLFHLWEG